MTNSFGVFLCEKRKEANITQKQLAAQLFVSESAVSKWEKDRARPDISLLPRLAENLAVTEHELITASVDIEHRATVKHAKKWRTVVTAWDMFFYISYGIALLTCFIVNLAVSQTLSWFWIVFTSILLAASFTTIPKFVKKYKLIIIPVVQMILLFLLLLTVNLTTRGNWFFVSALPILTVFATVFLPIFIMKFPCLSVLKKHCAIFSITVDFLLLLLMLFVVEQFSNTAWFVNVALPIAFYCLLFPLSLVAITRYLRLDPLIKAGLALVVWGVLIMFINPIVNTLMFRAFQIPKPSSYLPNFSVWNETMISNNTIAILLIAMLILFVVLIAVGVIKRRRQLQAK